MDASPKIISCYTLACVVSFSVIVELSSKAEVSISLSMLPNNEQ
jgi:hypothetical protein